MEVWRRLRLAEIRRGLLLTHLLLLLGLRDLLLLLRGLVLLSLLCGIEMRWKSMLRVLLMRRTPGLQ
jgi:hypothetical protein